MGARGEREAFSTVEVRVSVICTARDAEGTLARTVQSVLEQDMAEWEMIIVDDGSTDRTLEIARAFAARDGRIRIVATPGIGRGRALNLAVAHARANLIANIDADDESHPVRLRLQLQAAQQHPEFGVICSKHVLVTDHVDPVWPEHIEATVRPVDVTHRLTRRNPVVHSSALLRKDALLSAGGYSADRRDQFDYELWVRLAERGCRIGRIEAPLVAKRQHDAQFFDNSPRLAYALASAQIQVRATRSLGGGVPAFALIPLRVLWLLLPRRLRLRLHARRFAGLRDSDRPSRSSPKRIGRR
jgi:glycosyltransferase involved in cell wall biosynthesis